jgi:hypothetical protein
MIKVGSKEIKNLASEMDIQTFEKVSSFINDNEAETFEKWINIFVYLGADESEINEMDFNEFRELVREFNQASEKIAPVYTQMLEIDGYTYQSFEEEFKLSVRDLKYIEKSIKKDPTNYLARMMAIIFKRTDLTPTEHYADAHIDFKTKLFKKQNAELVIPFVAYVGNKLNETIQKVKEDTENEDTNGVASN